MNDKPKLNEEQLKEEKRFVKGAVVRVWDKEEKDFYASVKSLSGSGVWMKNSAHWRYAAPPDWETLGYTCAPDDAEWFVRDASRELVWGYGTKPKPSDHNTWMISNKACHFCGIITAYCIPTHEPADDWRDSFRRIERI